MVNQTLFFTGPCPLPMYGIGDNVFQYLLNLYTSTLKAYQ